jgi:AraC-like DNA-binding protein
MALTDVLSLRSLPGPFSGHSVFRTTDVDEASTEVGRMYSPHHLRLMDDGADFFCEVDSARLGPVTVSHLSYSSPVVISSTDPESWYAVTWPVAGRADLRQDEDETVTGPDRAGVVNAEGPVQFRWGEDLELLSARIDHAALLAQLGRLLGAPPDRPLRFDHSMSLDGNGAAWVDLLDLVARLVSSPDDAAANPLVSSRVEEAVLTALLLSQPNTYSRHLRALPPHAPARAVRRTAELVEATPERPHTRGSMAAETGVSLASLEAAFRELTGTTPPAFLSGARLSRAHHELASADPDDVTVPEVALRWGFDDPASFARLYLRRYGMSPGETLRGD